MDGMSVADSVCEIATLLLKEDMERIEGIFTMTKPKAEKLVSLLPERMVEGLMAAASLTDEEKAVIRACFRQGKTYVEAADALFLGSERTVQRISKAAMDKLVLLLKYTTLIFRAACEGA